MVKGSVGIFVLQKGGGIRQELPDGIFSNSQPYQCCSESPSGGYWGTKLVKRSVGRCCKTCCQVNRGDFFPRSNRTPVIRSCDNIACDCSSQVKQTSSRHLCDSHATTTVRQTRREKPPYKLAHK